MLLDDWGKFLVVEAILENKKRMKKVKKCKGDNERLKRLKGFANAICQERGWYATDTDLRQIAQIILLYLK